MKTREVTVTIKYKVFEVGELVEPASPRCVLPPGVYVVTRFIPPAIPYALDGTVFVEGERYGVSAEYLTSVAGEIDEGDRERVLAVTSKVVDGTTFYGLRVVPKEEV